MLRVGSTVCAQRRCADTETDYEMSPASATGDDDTDPVPAGGFAPSGAQVAWLEADLAAVRPSCHLYPPVSRHLHVTVWGLLGSSLGEPCLGTAPLVCVRGVHAHAPRGPIPMHLPAGHAACTRALMLEGSA